MIRRPRRSPLFPYTTLSRSVFGRVGNVQRHHQLPRLVGTIGCGAMIEVRREREEALRRQAVADISDVSVQPPIFVEHENARSSPAYRTCEIARCHPPVRSKIDHGWVFPTLTSRRVA